MNNKFINKSKFSTVVLFSMVFVLLFSVTTFAQASKLSLVDIFTALRSSKATLQQKNDLLIEGVKERGITFALNEVLQEELKNAGANELLIEAIRQQSPTPTKKIEVEPTPKPEPTPAPKDFAYYKNEGNSNYVLGSYDAAIENYTEAISLNQEDANVFFSRGLAYYNQKQFSLAAEDFTKVIELKPEESRAFLLRGNALKEIGKFEEALTDYKKTVELDPENASAKNAFDKLEGDLKAIKPDTIETLTVDQPKNDETASQPTENADSDIPVRIDSLQNLAKKLVSPVYPSLEKEIGIEGVVTVKITIDEKGKVIAAEAISGPKGLRKPSVVAAKRSKFKPHIVNDIAVKAIGFVNYNFKK